MNKSGKFLSLAVAGLLWPATPAAAAINWDAEIYGGSAWNAQLPMLIRQAGYPDLRLNADFHARPYNPDAIAPYYDVRIARWDGDCGWEVEELHDKLFLVNDIPAIGEFWVTHGFNYVFLNRTYRKGTWTLRFGAGPVLTHAEVILRGRDADIDGNLGHGYSLSGPGAQVELGKRVYLDRALYAVFDVKLTGAYAVIPFKGGYADLWNLAFQYQGGVGIDF